MERLFPGDILTKRERVEAALNLQPVDRMPILEQLSYNPRVIADWTGKDIRGFDYTIEDICAVIRQTTDLIMPPVAPRGTERHTTADGFVYQHDNWTTWRVSRPFDTTEGARDWLVGRTEALEAQVIQSAQARAEHHGYMTDLQAQIGETVILKYHDVGFCAAFDSMGLELFSYFVYDYPGVFARYMAASGRGGWSGCRRWPTGSCRLLSSSPRTSPPSRARSSRRTSWPGTTIRTWSG